MKIFKCNCSTEYTNGGFCPYCNTKRVEIVNKQVLEQILAQKFIESEIPEINSVAQFFYWPQFVRYLEHMKRVLPVSYAKSVDDTIDYVQRNWQLIDIKQNFGGYLQDPDFKQKIIGLYKKLKREYDEIKKFGSELAYIESIKLIGQINAIENFFNQAQFFERKEDK
jgi:hypothetical protein